MAELGDENRCTHLDERRPDTKNNLAADEHIERRGEELHDDAGDDDNGAQGGGNTAACLVTDPAKEDEGNETADGIGGAEEPQGRTRGMAELLLPRRKDLHAIGHALPRVSILMGMDG